MKPIDIQLRVASSLTLIAENTSSSGATLCEWVTFPWIVSLMNWRRGSLVSIGRRGENRRPR